MEVINFVVALVVIAVLWWLTVRLLDRSLAQLPARSIPDNRVRPVPRALTNAHSRKDSA